MKTHCCLSTTSALVSSHQMQWHASGKVSGARYRKQNAQEALKLSIACSAFRFLLFCFVCICLFCFSLQGLFFIALLSCRKKKRFPGSVVSLNPRIFWPGFGIEQQTGSFCKAASRPALGINIDQHTCIPRTAEIWWHRLVSRIAIEYHHQHNYTVK